MDGESAALGRSFGDIHDFKCLTIVISLTMDSVLRTPAGLFATNERSLEEWQSRRAAKMINMKTALFFQLTDRFQATGLLSGCRGGCARPIRVTAATTTHSAAANTRS